MLTIIDMRIPGGWNGVLLVSFVFILVFLNYLNIIPLSQTFPFLSFLPHESKPKITKQVTTATPTPIPTSPITVKRIDLIKGEGEFIINNPTPQTVQVSPEKQIVLDGTYDTNTKKVTIQTSVQNSTIPIHPIPPLLNDSSTIVLSLQIVINDKPIYQTPISLITSEKTSLQPFKVRVPFYSEFVIKIYEGSQELFSQLIKL